MTVLVLGGTGEARQIAGKLARAGRPAVVSLAGALRRPAPQPLPLRIGGFGGEGGFRSYLEQAGISAVLDATHPFAARISARSARVCADLGLPHALLNRPGWQAEPGDRWTTVAGAQEGSGHIPTGARVFLATGRSTLADFASLAPGRQLFLRVVDPPQEPFPYEGAYLVGRPPFDLTQEEALLRDRRIDWLVAKNAGGAGGRPKLLAARNLGLPVLMLARPPLPACRVLSTVEEAEAWLRTL
ncbi:cobalt-precorrin-6A reductase [Pseudooceanicola algae]|uniref:Precorrin-6A reductase n=1 Tax=Pseudooceanicola algae TaxID=1537215 RepID=A0A418SCL6_9RHOB|nr:cobalt-precorrin-6A reductase [Pseudooceanicola algae]QPM89895.1 Precorrin-6A reductase [Pseudooceanicola algae]